MNKTLIGLGLLLSFTAQAQIFPPSPSIWANSELNHSFGTNTTYGQAIAFYPANVFGPPPSSASPDNPSYQQTDVVSLGRGGYVSLGFFPTIENRSGYDFIVFENVLRTGSGDFGEWMMVQASMDGVTWKTFPYDSLTGKGLAGIRVTKGNGTPKDTSSIGGDAFDLSDIGMDSAKYVRLIDATLFQEKLGCGICTSPELDAVGAVHQVGDPNTYAYANNGIKGFKAFYAKQQLIVQNLFPDNIQIDVYNLLGNKMASYSVNNYGKNIDLNNIPNGFYVLSAHNSKGQSYKFSFYHQQ